MSVPSFDWSKPTVQMLGRWQPFHDGHVELLLHALDITGQVVIMCRHMPIEENNPFNYLEVSQQIREKLKDTEIREGVHYQIMPVPNVVNISYGRDVGYTFTEHDLGAFIHDISATKIRQRMREEGELK